MSDEREPATEAHVVLVVDDDAEVRGVIVEILATEPDLEVHGVAGGTAALEFLSSMHPHLVLLDLAMPGMDGVELAELLRAWPGRPDLALVGMTALGARAGARQEALAAGCAVVLDKPLEIDVLLETIRRHLPQRSIAQS